MACLAPLLIWALKPGLDGTSGQPEGGSPAEVPSNYFAWRHSTNPSLVTPMTKKHHLYSAARAGADDEQRSLSQNCDGPRRVREVNPETDLDRPPDGRSLKARRGFARQGFARQSLAMVWESPWDPGLIPGILGLSLSCVSVLFVSCNLVIYCNPFSALTYAH